mmetsp:Transcript_91016/g.266504  ORF Transcript_91016/g.266504 Transcript_91016/m.266504 type:complete len:80 (+) Transcript_91016:145-384(+)
MLLDLGASAGGGEKLLLLTVQLNPNLGEVSGAKMGALQQVVEAMNPAQATKLPLMVYVHGRPPAATTDAGDFTPSTKKI